VNPEEALHTTCVSAYIFHAAEAAILFDDAGARMDWPTPTPSEPIEEHFLSDEQEPFRDGLREGEARNRNFLKVMARARREVDGETLLCPIRISHQRLHDRPGEVAVKVACEPLVPRGITYRRASEAEALADCHA
jgi:hypothetical protein